MDLVKPQGNALITVAPRGREDTAFSQLLRCSSRNARQRIPLRIARQYSCLAIGIHENPEQEFVSILCGHELSETERRDLQFVCGCPVELSTFDRASLIGAIEILYARDAVQHTEESVTTDHAEGHLSSVSSIRDLSLLCRQMILEAVFLRCSDIHIEWGAANRIRFRICGELVEREQFSITRNEGTQLCRHIKVLASLDSCTPNLAQEGTFAYEEDGVAVRVRLSILPTASGEKFVIRLLQNGYLEDIAHLQFERALQALGLFPEQRILIEQFMRADRGALLVSGPTGSGKSTLLYLLLRHISRVSTNVVSIEDPVEAQIENVCQVDISNTEYTYEHMVAKVLRQDPDALLLGEIRTPNTAKTALQAALTGTRILSTVHAGTCFEVVARLRELGVSETLLGLALHSVSAQRLLPRLCRHCSEPIQASSEVQTLFQLSSAQLLYTARGCDRCVEADRIAVYEILPLNERLKTILRNPAGDFLRTFAAAAFEEGFRSYAYYVRRLLLEGTISPAVARRALGV